ncbi:succinate dehydrogenase assembly factor 4, mitochondrial [Halyomorpha halys]|uniref:succinate dehydrogenase assembly factor 4, mitochondrial n=1 Tax=Halyomorpha halys TaxID=286706 RepID=UPI0006D4FFCD|nr:succinate dehydrogenase assembly factor 4, mitochondrial-like [Halyomorpha halys]
MIRTTRILKNSSFIEILCPRYCSDVATDKNPKEKKSSRKSLLQKTPLGKLDEFEGRHPHQEKEPLKGFEGGVNPVTGEVGGPIGPEPTRYGDWERKGRVSDF